MRSNAIVAPASALLAAVALSVACSNVESPKKKATGEDAGNTSPIPTTTSTYDPGSFGSPPDAGPLSGDSGAVPGTCAANTICLDVTSVRPNGKPLPGRLVLLWAQLNREGLDPVAEAGYDVPFLGTETKVDIPIAQIAPPLDANLLCERACDDEYSCACQGATRVGVGYVVVLVDENQNGKADLGSTNIDSEQFVGVAAVGIGYSAVALKPTPQLEYKPGAFLPSLFTQGVELGVSVHPLVPSPAGPFDAMGAVAANTRFKLAVCDTTDENTCVPSWPDFP